MIISRTPFRISFVGGGSDLPSFYLNHGGGAVISTSINKYVYLSLHPYFIENKIFLKYSQNELVDDRKDIKHKIIRAVFDYFDISGVDLSSSADIPYGTGMASSSAFTSGLINVCASYKGIFLSKPKIAEIACEIEIDKLNEPIGKQDQYACTYGGLNLIEFHSNNQVTVEKIILKNSILHDINNNLLLFYLGKTRSASSILSVQKENIEKDVQNNSLKKMVSLVYDLKNALNESKINKIGEILDESWKLKKSLASGITNEFIDDKYEKAIMAGAIGGKLLGAGGGGFLLFYVEDKFKNSVISALSDLVLTNFNFDNSGTNIIF